MPDLTFTEAPSDPHQRTASRSRVGLGSGLSDRFEATEQTRAMAKKIQLNCRNITIQLHIIYGFVISYRGGKSGFLEHTGFPLSFTHLPV